MTKLLFAIPLLLLGALPAEAHRGQRHRHVPAPQYRLICGQHGCAVKFKQPKVRVSENCVWKPWSNTTVCRY